MSSHDSQLHHRPFKHLKQLMMDHASRRRPAEATPGHRTSNADIPPTTGKTDHALFWEAMADVSPIKQRNRHCPSSPSPPQPINRLENDTDEGLRRLASLVTTGDGFQVALTPEYMEGICHPAPPDLTARLHHGSFSIQDHIDLHGLTAGEAQECLFEFLHGCTREGKRCVLIVHGRGLTSPKNPVLKEKIADWLFCGRWRKWVMAFTSARMVDGGAGATYVLLRRTPLTKRASQRPVTYFHPE